MRLTNPFPGHNPFIEQRWGDFHTAMINELRNAMQYALPDALRARVEETAVVEEEGARPVFTWPDVRVFEKPGRRQPTGGGGGAGGVAVAEPVAPVEEDELDRPTLLEREPDARVERHIVILDKTTGGRIVTAIEVVSPWNKRGKGKARYIQRQNERLDAGVNVVEIDLIRDGEDVTLVRDTILPDRLRARHHVCSWAATQPDRTAYWGVEITRRLPVITIPLRVDDKPLKLALQAVYDRCYEMGRYDDVDLTARVYPEPTAAERAVIEAARLGQARPAAGA